MTVAQQINRERVAVLGWGRAILLQLAHPLVAAGVAGHSSFSGGRLSRLKRLHATVGAMLDFTFGDERRVQAVAARINAIHRRVHGCLPEAAGSYPAGTRYSATDPRLLQWVHATLLDSMPLAYERFVGPLGPDARDRYCAESAVSGRLLGIPDEFLISATAELEAYVSRMLGSDEIAVTTAARRVARELLYPPLADPTRPAAWAVRLATLGLLPASIRQAYGFPWRPRHDRALDLLARAIRRALPLTPSSIRCWPVRSRCSP